MALALDGGKVQALPQVVGPGQWADESLQPQPWRLDAETRREADGVCLVAGADVPTPGEHAVGVARQGCGRLGQVDYGQAGVFAAYASRQGSTRRTASGGSGGSPPCDPRHP